MNISPIVASPPPSRPRPGQRSAVVLTATAILSVATSFAQDNDLDQFADLSLEDLMTITVTSVSKQEENLRDAAAAVFVLSNEDIRRSGATTLPEALRLVPGLTVTSGSSSHWGVSMRGFHDAWYNKLLVLVDGRSVYNPMIGAVHWDVQHSMLQDLDRIEVIRGPGATMWGANAVNGVINIVSKSARDTQGSLLYAGGGNVHQTLAGARYGGQTGEKTFYRVFSTFHQADDFPLPNGDDSRDAWKAWHGGFRMDHHPDPLTHMTWQIDGTATEFDHGESDSYNVNTIGRWTREVSPDSFVETQLYFDRSHRDELLRARVSVDTVDFTLQHTLPLGPRNNFIWGSGYRFIESEAGQTSQIFFPPDHSYTQNIFSAFAQNEFEVIPDIFSVTAGTKVEHNNYTGVEVQPSVRAMYKPTPSQTVWAAISRAVRTPGSVETEPGFSAVSAASFPGPGGHHYLPMVFSNPDLESEILLAYELGYRVQPNARLNFDVSTFFNDYSEIVGPGGDFQFVPPPAGAPANTPGAAMQPFRNLVDVYTYGGELSATVAATDSIRLATGYSLVIIDTRETRGANSSYFTDRTPVHQLFVHSHFDLTPRSSVDAMARYVDAFQNVPSYITADLQYTFLITDQLQLSLVGQNLLEKQHREMDAIHGGPVTEVPRGFYGKLTWRF